MIDFVTEEQFLRARKILRKIAYRRTLDKKTGIYGRFGRNFEDGYIDVEGHKVLKIYFTKFHATPEELSKLREIEEIKERDKIIVRSGGGDMEDGKIVIKLYEKEDEEEEIVNYKGEKKNDRHI